MRLSPSAIRKGRRRMPGRCPLALEAARQLDRRMRDFGCRGVATADAETHTLTLYWTHLNDAGFALVCRERAVSLSLSVRAFLRKFDLGRYNVRRDGYPSFPELDPFLDQAARDFSRHA
ncbi:MAG: hypothetical protein OXG96_03795 [Acidobacteria bacterium]|nr:hypothetical protein [Acidobacteriota bacterium]